MENLSAKGMITIIIASLVIANLLCQFVRSL